MNKLEFGGGGRLIYNNYSLLHAVRRVFLFFLSASQRASEQALWGRLQKSNLVFSSHIFVIKVLVFTFAFALSKGMLNAKGEILKNTLFSLFFSFFSRWKQGWVVGRLDEKLLDD